MDKINSMFDKAFVPVITPEIEAAVIGVWNAIAPDAAEVVEDNECAVEMCIDANRLSTFGYQNEESAVTKLIAEFGYMVVLKALSKKVRIA